MWWDSVAWFATPLFTVLVTIAAYLWLRPRPDGRHMHCLKCGYDLRGNVSGTCPECGTAIADAHAGKAR